MAVHNLIRVKIIRSDNCSKSNNYQKITVSYTTSSDPRSLAVRSKYSRLLVQLSKLSSSAAIKCGVFRGNIFGPLLFLRQVNDIYSATELATSLFADDTFCLKERKNLLIPFVNTELQKVAT
jgi:hypothetical protein